jgi:nitrogen regulatory protein P-II 1
MSTDYGKITAIVRSEFLERVERALQDQGVSGVSVSRVKGYGEYVDFFASDWMSRYVRIEVITGAQRTGTIIDAILEAASSGTKGDGIVTLAPIERVWRIRTRSAAPPSEL